jgi:hypothetical protein
MIGPGKYNELVTVLKKTTEAKGVLLIVIGGRLGDGFSVQANPELAAELPAILRIAADDMEEDFGKLTYEKETQKPEKPEGLQD